MKRILSYLIQFFKEDFHPGYYLSVAVFLALSITANYTLDFENGILRKHFGKPEQIFYYFIFYALPYFFTLFAYAYFRKDFSIFKSPKNLLIILVALFVLSFNFSLFTFFHSSSYFSIPIELKRFFYNCLANILYSIHFIIPLLVFRYTINRELDHFYGLQWKDVDWKTYLPLLAIAILLAALASFDSHFLQVYPTYDAGRANAYWQISPLVTVAIYELLYGLQFLCVELFFRGFLIIGMIKFLGKAALLPMVSVYAFCHFGKPLGETVSSIFGGYILGVLAYYTHNIWGGVLLHVGIAWAMEAAAFLQKSDF